MTARRAIRRTLAGVALALLVFAAVVGVEIWLALRREYLPTADPLDLDATFGTGDRLNFVVLGDSTSAGVGVDDPADAYPTLLAERLADETGRSIRLSVLGESGARVRDVLDEQVPAALELDPDVIFVGIGANDVTHLTSLGEVRELMRAILGRLDDTGAAIVVAGAPDMRALAWAEPLRSLAYLRGKQVATAIEEEARGAGAGVVELAEETGPFFAEDPGGHFSEDQFHPSALGYRRWADAIFPVLAGAVTSAP
ncbi:MAG TPA: SGNH/GDSL hydrolase family protein [Actinomycetota bacterium]|nr:SGNH/GDSL hydrolase family protein [Actinomycetota bacterium]